jgi:large subunit ribosomal protein L17
MRHRVEGRKLGREKAHRTALFRNLVKSLLVSPQGRIETTLAKAKSLRSYAERMITYGKKDTVSSRRQAYSFLGNRTLVKKLFDEIAPQMQDRNGGYTRILKTGFRKGDSAPMAIIEFVRTVEHEEKEEKPAKKAKAVKKPATDKKTKKTEVKETTETKAKPAKKSKKEAKLIEELEDIKAADLMKEPESEPEIKAEPETEPESAEEEEEIKE